MKKETSVYIIIVHIILASYVLATYQPSVSSQHERHIHILLLGDFLRPTQAKWYHTKQLSQIIELCSSSIISSVHLPQYHVGLSRITETTLLIASHASRVQYFLHMSKQTFSSVHDDETISGLISIFSSSIIRLPSMASFAICESTNQVKITTKEKLLIFKVHMQ